MYILSSKGQEESATYWQAVLNSNQHQKIRLAELVGKNEKTCENTKIAVFGFSYKKNTSDTRTTPVALFVHRLALKGFHVTIHDPQVT